MKTLRNILGLHFSALVLFGILFPLLIWSIGLVFPNRANGLPVRKEGKIVGYENIGQNFTAGKYFHGRPSAVSYNAASTGASNKGPTNRNYIETVKANIDTFLYHNPEIKREDIPVDLVTFSSSGIDPHISYQAAIVQIPRIAVVRKIDRSILKQLVDSCLEGPLLGILGPEKINVLKLNLTLDSLGTN